MKTVRLSGSPRESVGKKDAKAQRKEGRVPCVLYGGSEQVHFSAEEKNFKNIVFTPEVMFIKIDLNGTLHNAILQDIQYHPVTDRILHADFMELHDDKEIKMNIPVLRKGTSKGVLRGGKLSQRIRKLPVKALPGNMPESITLDITDLEIGNSIKVKDIIIPNVTVLSNPYNTVISVKTARGVSSASLEAGEKEGAPEGGEAEAPAEGGSEE